jgi:predicted PurR-regulated permease PerM
MQRRVPSPHRATTRHYDPIVPPVPGADDLGGPSTEPHAESDESLVSPPHGVIDDVPVAEMPNGAAARSAARFPVDEAPHTRRLPPWVLPATAIFWLGYLVTVLTQHLWNRLFTLVLLLLVSLFLALAIEPGVNRLARRGWRRGRATALILFGVSGGFMLFVAAIGTLVGTQIAELLQNSETYIRDTVDFLNDTFGTQIDSQEVIDDFNDPDGRVQQFIQSQGDEAIRLSLRAIAVMFQALSVLLFTYYLVADGPRLRRVICARLTPARQTRVLQAWELAITKTGGYLYSRALLALLSAFFHWVVFQAVGTQAPIALALWVGLVSQFLPVVGTYLAGVLPVLLTFLDSPLNAAIVIGFIVVYQQIENYFFAPRITARTMELHPAVAFGAALGGASLLGFVGALLALPAAAMVQALVSEWGNRYDVVDSHLTNVPPPKLPRGMNGRRPPAASPAASPGAAPPAVSDGS